jgi:hypothetical protein
LLKEFAVQISSAGPAPNLFGKINIIDYQLVMLPNNMSLYSADQAQELRA